MLSDRADWTEKLLIAFGDLLDITRAGPPDTNVGRDSLMESGLLEKVGGHN